MAAPTGSSPVAGAPPRGYSDRVVADEPALPAEPAHDARASRNRSPLSARLTAIAPVGALAIVAAIVAVVGGVVVLLTHPLMVDLEIPLRAAERWVSGGEPYLASSFSAPEGYGLPFLYPPPVLPFLAPLLALPRGVVVAAWLAATLGAAVFVARRLGVPWRAVPVVLCWVPFSEGLVGGNAQVLLVAGFVGLGCCTRGTWTRRLRRYHY